MIGKTNALAGGKQKFASGTSSNVNMTTKYSDPQNGSQYISYVEVTGLDFQPTAIICTRNGMAPSGIAIVDTSSMILNPDTLDCEILDLCEGSDSTEHLIARSYVNANKIKNGFRIPIRSNSSAWTFTYTFYWFAIGA